VSSIDYLYPNRDFGHNCTKSNISTTNWCECSLHLRC